MSNPRLSVLSREDEVRISFALKELSRPLDRRFTAHSECAICLDSLNPGDQVAPLPCDHRHYFHTDCIKDWAKRNQLCPLCNVAFTPEKVIERNKQFSLIFRPSIYNKPAHLSTESKLNVSNAANDWPDMIETKN